MLIVRRRAGDAILIGDTVEIEILELSGNQVKLGITAPREIPVLRREVLVAARENLAAADPVTEESLAEVLRFLG